MMKKLFYIALLLISYFSYGQYNPTLHTMTNKAIGYGQATPPDARSMYYDATNAIYRDYQSTNECLGYLNLSKYRVGGFDIMLHSGGILNSNGTYTGGVTLVYWFKGCTADTCLVQKINNGIGDTTALMRKANNLSDVTNSASARTNLGLGTMATQTISPGGDLSGNWPTITVSKFNGQPPSYYLNYGNLTNTPTIPQQLNPSAAGLMAITGTYPNLTFNAQTPTLQQTITQGNALSKIDTINAGGFPLYIQSTAALGLPTGTTVQRPSTPSTGYTRFNTDSVSIEVWNGSAWIKSGAGGGGGSGITALTGDVTASGTGSVPATLATVNTNTYASNTFLKFGVNGKGLVTSATPVLSSDITTALGTVGPNNSVIFNKGSTFVGHSFFTYDSLYANLNIGTNTISNTAALSYPKTATIVNGYGNNVGGHFSITSGDSNTTAYSGSGAYSFTFGKKNQNSGGLYVTMIGHDNYNYGSNNWIIGNYDSTSGGSNLIVGDSSKSYGGSTIGKGLVSNAFGSLVVGQYNDTTGLAALASSARPSFIVGVGTGMTSRKNAFRVWPSGLVEITNLKNNATKDSILQTDANGYLTQIYRGALRMRIGALNSQPKSSNVLTVVADSIMEQGVNASFPGVITTGTDTMSGTKQFNGNVIVNGSVLQVKGTGVASGTASVTFSDSQTPVLSNTNTKQWLQINPLSTGLPFSMGVSSTLVNTGDTANSVFTWGQNLGPGVVPIVTGKPALGYSIESWYQPNAGGSVLQEAHMQYVSRSGVQFRPFSYTINSATNDVDYYNGVNRMYMKLPGTNFTYHYFDITTDSNTVKYTMSNKAGSASLSTAGDKSMTISNTYASGNRNLYMNNSWDFVYLPGLFSSGTYNQLNVSTYPSGDGITNFGGPANRWNHLDGVKGRFTNGVLVGDYTANQDPAHELDITKNDTTGVSPTISLVNSSPIMPTGSSGYNLSAVTTTAGNGAVTLQFGANYGIGKTNPWTVPGAVIATRTDHPITFWTGATPTEKMRLFNNGNLVVGTSPADNGLAKLQVGGKVTISTVDSVGTQTGGCLFLDYASKLVKMGPCGSGGGTPTYFINSKLGDTTFRTTGPGLAANTIQWKGLIPGNGMNSVTTDSTIKYNWGGNLAQATTINNNGFTTTFSGTGNTIISGGGQLLAGTTAPIALERVRVFGKLAVDTLASGTSGVDSQVVWNATNKDFRKVAPYSTPTLQQTISAGNALTQNNSVLLGAYTLKFTTSGPGWFTPIATPSGRHNYTFNLNVPDSSLGISWQQPAGFTKGSAIVIDTNNNVFSGAIYPAGGVTGLPQWSTGNNVGIAYLQVTQAMFSHIRTISATTTLTIGSTNGDRTILVDATAGSIVITLPAASASYGSNTGLELVFRRIDASANTVTIQRAGTDTIDGATNFTMSSAQVKRIQAASASAWYSL